MSDLYFQSQFPLQGLNTLALRATAEYFVAPSSNEEILESLQFARDQSLPITVLGGGSNVLLPEKIPGLVIHPASNGIELLEQDNDSLLVKVAAGENWHILVMHCLEQGWYGLENLALIPGDVGAAPIQNIGAYGIELKEHFDSLEAIDLASGELLEMKAADCLFGYRDSIFKNRLRNKLVITSVTLKLSATPELQLNYPALSSLLNRDVTPMDVARKVIDIRSSKLPDPQTLPNVGSFFKNPVVPIELAAEIRSRYPHAATYSTDNGEKIAAAWLIDTLGWKGRRIGDVAVHDQQALVLVNRGAATRDDVLAVATDIAADVKSHFGIDLEIEPVEINPTP